MRLVLAACALLALNACKPSPPTAPPAASAKPVKTTGWALGVGRRSVEMVNIPASGDSRDSDLSLICAKGDGFLVLLPRLKAATGETFLTVAAGDRSHTLSVKPFEHGVQASGPLNESLLVIFEGAAPFRFQMGGRVAGPYPPPPEAMRRAFAVTCRRLNGESSV